MGLTQISMPHPSFSGADVRPICLIIPPSVFLMDERVFMTLGILRVAAVIEQAGIKVEVLDLSGISNFLEAVKDHCSFSKAKFFGLTATTPQLPAATQITEVIRAVRPDARIILGGPHITLVNAAYKNELKKKLPTGRAIISMRQMEGMFDILVAGDGEEAIFEALKPSAPKLIDADDIKSPLFLTNKKLTDLPFPARHLVDVNSYHYSIDGVRAHSMIAQLGCPFECGFCGGRSSAMLRKIRMRTSQDVVDEIVELEETYNIRGFMMYDDELNVNPKLMELLDLMEKTQKDRGVEWRFRGFIKAELFTQKQADAMYRAGFRWILVGFESGSPKILNNINKKATREENTRCVELAHAAGLKVKALMSVGHPGETAETVEETRQWLLQTKPDDFDLTIITCYPGTPYYDEAVPHPDKKGVWIYTYQKTGDQLYQEEVDYTTTADYYKGNVDGGYKAYVYTEELSSEALVSLRDKVERDVRERLHIPFNQGAPGVTYEHSMGQMGPLPPNILRTSNRTSTTK